MCIILYKPKGSTIPEKMLRTSWENNPDGAGLMILRPNTIEISKGYMKLKPLLRAVKKALTPDVEGAIHFRIATSGVIDAGNTHPFAVSKDIKLLRSTETHADAALMHNGVLGEGDSLLSDTALFARDILSPLLPIIEKPELDSTLHRLLTIPGQRMLFARCTKTGSCLIRTGEWEFDAETGVWASNTSYRPKPKKALGDGVTCPNCGSSNAILLRRETRIYCDSCHVVSDPCEACTKADCRLCPVWESL